MCGIFGLLVGHDGELSTKAVKNISDKLFRLSASRGKEASGFCSVRNGRMEIQRYSEPSSELIKKAEYRMQFSDDKPRDGRNIPTYPFAIVGHSRLATSGWHGINQNNQPINTGTVVGVHNGVVGNYRELLEEYKHIEWNTDNDSEVVFRLFVEYLERSNSLSEAVMELYRKIEGSVSIAALFF